MTLHLCLAFVQMGTKRLLRHFRKNAIQSHADRVYFCVPKRIGFRVVQCLKVHKDFEFRQTAGHEFAIAAKDIATTGLDIYAISLHTVGHFHPIIALGRHDIEGLADYRNGQKCHQQCESTVTRHDFVMIKLTQKC